MLLKRAFRSSKTYFHTAEEVTAPTDDICKTQGIPSYLVDDLTQSKSLAEKGIFLSYDNPLTYDLALSDDALNTEIERQIGVLLELFHPETHFGEADHKLYKTALCALVDQNIVTRHQHIRDKRDNDVLYLQRTKPTLSFKSIVNELKENYRVQNEFYWNLICRENFEKAYKEQLDECYLLLENSCIDIEAYDQTITRLETLRINVIEPYFPNDCVSFLRQIYPHEALGARQHQFYAAISEPQKIKSVFLDFIQKVAKPVDKLTLECKDNILQYQPSCISFNETDPNRKFIEVHTVKVGLATNHNKKSSIHKNVDFIVVNSTDANEVIPAGIEKITEVESYKASPTVAKETDKYTNEKQVSFIDSRRAIGEING